MPPRIHVLLALLSCNGAVAWRQASTFVGAKHYIGWQRVQQLSISPETQVLPNAPCTWRRAAVGSPWEGLRTRRPVRLAAMAGSNVVAQGPSLLRLFVAALSAALPTAVLRAEDWWPFFPLGGRLLMVWISGVRVNWLTLLRESRPLRVDMLWAGVVQDPGRVVNAVFGILISAGLLMDQITAILHEKVFDSSAGPTTRAVLTAFTAPFHLLFSCFAYSVRFVWSCIPHVFDEIYFRGVVWALLASKGYPLWLTLLITTGLAFLISDDSREPTLNAVARHAKHGVLRMLSGSVAPCVAATVVYRLVASLEGVALGLQRLFSEKNESQRQEAGGGVEHQHSTQQSQDAVDVNAVASGD